MRSTSSTILDGEPVQVMIETPSGPTFSGEADHVSISSLAEFDTLAYNQDHRPITQIGLTRFEINMTVSSLTRWVNGHVIAQQLARKFTPREWECRYCGRANLLSIQQCGSCGWYRGVLADTIGVLQESGIWRVK